MATVAVLTGRRVNWRRLRRRLAAAGYTTTDRRVAQGNGRGAVDLARTDLAGLPDRAARSARQLLGVPPRDGVSCSFAGPAAPSEEWSTVVALARAVAADVPLAVLDDLVDTAYLVHPGIGLLGPDEYRSIPEPRPFWRWS